MYIFLERLFGYTAIDKHPKEGRPHIEKIKSVEAMRYHQHISCKSDGVCLYAAYKNYKVAEQTANCGVEEGCGKPAQRKIVGYEL